MVSKCGERIALCHRNRRNTSVGCSEPNTVISVRAVDGRMIEIAGVSWKVMTKSAVYVYQTHVTKVYKGLSVIVFLQTGHLKETDNVHVLEVHWRVTGKEWTRNRLLLSNCDGIKTPVIL